MFIYLGILRKKLSQLIRRCFRKELFDDLVEFVFADTTVRMGFVGIEEIDEGLVGRGNFVFESGSLDESF